eukprot:scaffold316267_cov18-Tisochrysis_lutea.AAC.1
MRCSHAHGEWGRDVEAEGSAFCVWWGCGRRSARKAPRPSYVCSIRKLFEFGMLMPRRVSSLAPILQVSALLGSKTLSEYLSELEEENGQPASPGVISAKEAAEARRKAAEEKAAKERAELDAVIAARRAEREER